MDSINRNQPEDTHKNLQGAQAVAKIKEMVKRAENCFFCTTDPATGKEDARPMNVRQVDDAGNLWFLSAADSHKNAEVQAEPEVRLYFQGSAHSDFLAITGKAMVSTDKAKIKELWEPILKTWFTGGVDDPRITVIRVAPTSGYYWDTKHGNLVAGVKMLIGAVIGQTMDDSVEGKLTV